MGPGRSISEGREVGDDVLTRCTGAKVSFRARISRTQGINVGEGAGMNLCHDRFGWCGSARILRIYTYHHGGEMSTEELLMDPDSEQV